MVRTRVGYAGGTTTDPTYHEIGDHTETIEIDFDPQIISYGELLDLFFAQHNACARPWSRQYMSAIFTNSSEQLSTAKARAERVAAKRGKPVQTVIEPTKRFYLAEDYHQKYRLRGSKRIAAELLAIYPESIDFVNSTAAARLNGYLAGYGDPDAIARDLKRLGLSPESRAEIEKSRR